MKIKLIRSDLKVPPGIKKTDQMTDTPKGLFWNVGAVIDVPPRAVQLLVGNGDAEPECAGAKKLCSDYEAKRAERKLSRDMLAAGIEPEDRERFRNGEIVGYDADGNDIPGPNWKGDVEE